MCHRNNSGYGLDRAVAFGDKWPAPPWQWLPWHHGFDRSSHSAMSAKVGKKAIKHQLSKPETGVTSPGYQGPRVARSSLRELGMIRSAEAARMQGEGKVLGNTCAALEGMSCTDVSRQAFALKHLVCSGRLSPSASLPRVDRTLVELGCREKPPVPWDQLHIIPLSID